MSQRGPHEYVDPLEVMRLARAGLTIKEAAEQIGCHRSTVSTIAAEVGVKFVPGNKSHGRVEEAIELRRQGASWREVGDAVEMSGSGARKAVLTATGGEDPAPMRTNPSAGGLDGLRAHLVQHRVDQGLTQYDMADRLGVTQGWVSMFERGSRSSVPMVGTLAKYAAALEMQVEIALLDASGSRLTTVQVEPDGREIR